MGSVIDALSRYGGRAYYVLKAAIEVTEENRRLGLSRLGDFDYRSLVAKLRSWGIDYNPSNLLKELEKDYGIIRTVYRSSNQRWWVFNDMTSVRLALAEGKEDAGDPEEELLTIQIAAIDVDRMISDLSSFLGKERPGPADERRIKEIVFTELPQAVEVYNRASRYGEKYAEFLSKVRRALDLARKAVLLMRGKLPPAQLGTAVAAEETPVISELRQR
jgi:hypothetical protein